MHCQQRMLWREYFKDLLNSTNTPLRTLGMGSHISGAEVAEVAKKLLVGKAPGVLESRVRLDRASVSGGAMWFSSWTWMSGPALHPLQGAWEFD